MRAPNRCDRVLPLLLLLWFPIAAAALDDPCQQARDEIEAARAALQKEQDEHTSVRVELAEAKAKRESLIAEGQTLEAELRSVEALVEERLERRASSVTRLGHGPCLDLEGRLYATCSPPSGAKTYEECLHEAAREVPRALGFEFKIETGECFLDVVRKEDCPSEYSYLSSSIYQSTSVKDGSYSLPDDYATRTPDAVGFPVKTGSSTKNPNYPGGHECHTFAPQEILSWAGLKKELEVAQFRFNDYSWDLQRMQEPARFIVLENPDDDHARRLTSAVGEEGGGGGLRRLFGTGYYDERAKMDCIPINSANWYPYPFW